MKSQVRCVETFSEKIFIYNSLLSASLRSIDNDEMKGIRIRIMMMMMMVMIIMMMMMMITAKQIQTIAENTFMHFFSTGSPPFFLSKEYDSFWL